MLVNPFIVHLDQQAAALSGCLVSPLGRNCEHAIKVDSQGRKICNDPAYLEHGLKFLKQRNENKFIWCPVHDNDRGNDNSTWIYDIASMNGYVTFFGEEFCYNGSPWVVQENIFNIHGTVDYGVHEVFCRLAERKAEQEKICQYAEGKKKQRCELYLLELNGNVTDPLPCLDGLLGKPKQRIALDILTRLWDIYKDIPRFAYLNAIAAHDYSVDSPNMALGAEAYDQHLSDFLRSLLESEGMKDTVVVLRSDHGLQGGPSIIDYSTQIEHRHPWTEIIVPAGLPGISLGTLIANQEKLVTGFDLYRTIRSLMSSNLRGTDGESSMHPPVPDWSFDILSSDIPPMRTCKDARIPPNHCPYKFQQPDFSPRFGICNIYEDGLDRFCPDWPEIRKRRCDLNLTRSTPYTRKLCSEVES